VRPGLTGQHTSYKFGDSHEMPAICVVICQRINIQPDATVRLAANVASVKTEGPDPTALLQAIDKKLHVLLALAIADRVPETSRAAKRSLDSVLRASGLSLGEIGTLMGKSKQAVSQALATDVQRPSSTRKTSSSARKTTSPAKKVGRRG
jgi:hypothetical protein